jgi:YD repeat-containing protein
MTARTGGKTPEPAAGGEQLEEVDFPGRKISRAVKVGAELPESPVGVAGLDTIAQSNLQTLLARAEEKSTDNAGRIVGLVIPGADRRGGEWRVEYDDEDQVVGLIQTVDGAEQKTSYRYDEVGNLVETVAPNGAARQFEYDERDSVIGWREPSGRYQQYAWDERYQFARMSVTEADGTESHVVEYQHDGLGRLRLIRDITDPAAPVVTELQYDGYTVVGIWQRATGRPSRAGDA